MSAVGEPGRPNRLGRYELITRIGQGGMAEVQLALQRGPGGFEKLVVVKLVHDSLASQKAFVDMLLDEARVAALVKHPNVVDIYDLGQADGRFFIAMEYLEGEPLLAVLRAGREGKRLDPLSTGRLIADTAEGLDAAHELRSMSGERLELVHHDISLGNIVVLYNGQVKLVDFGVAKATQTAGGAKAKVQGKFSYMAPEKLRGAAGDRRSDIFSLGCVMWEALTLKRLFRGGNDGETMKQVLEMKISPPSKINGDVPPEYDPIVMRALDRNLEKRHHSAKELAVELEEMLRKRGYGAKNDRIAKYMQETFKGHIDARKKLVQEVVNKGSASAEVVDAAFNDPVLASGSPVSPSQGPDFSTKYRRVTPPAGVPVPAAQWADASRPTEISAPPIFDDGSGIDDDEDQATVLVTGKPGALPPPRAAKPKPVPAPGGRTALPPPARAAAGVPARVAPPPPKPATETTDVDAEPLPESMAAKPAAASVAQAAPSAADLAAGSPAVVTAELDVIEQSRAGLRQTIQTILADKKKRLYVGGAGALLLLVIIIVAASGGDETKPAAATDSDVVANTNTDDPDEDKGSDEQAGSADVGSAELGSAQLGSADAGSADTGSADVGSAGAGSGSAEPVIEIAPPDAGTVRKPPDRGDTKVDRPPPPRIDVPATVQQGLMAFVKGDTRDALALLQKAKAAKPRYAPTYRVLGRVYQKLGNDGAAKRAFQRYLALSPNASDADTIKEEIKKL